MSGIAAVLALAVQVVTLKPADLPTKPVYVRVGVGVDSRLAFADGLVRLHGHRATSDMLGLKLGQARPKTLLLLHPRGAGVGRLLFVGQAHTIQLVVEASVLGSAQDVELRVGESKGGDEPSTAASPAPATSQRPKISSVAPDAKRGQRTTATPRASAPSVDGDPGPPPPRPSRSARPHMPAVGRSLDGAPTPPPPRATSAAAATTPTVASALTRPEPPPDVAVAQPTTTTAEPATPEPRAERAVPAPAAAGHTPPPAPTVRRLMRRVGRPGQRGIVFEEVRRDGARLTLRTRIEGAAAAQFVQLDVAGVPAALSVEQAGRDLVVIGIIPGAAQPHVATLILNLAGRWHTAKLRLPGGGTA